ncbi:LysR family transcriptional regulator [bacterium]|nr:LysR family transcriptional regulator [bacterium]
MSREAGLDLVQSFLVLAEELNFRRASERLNLDQSALTRRIQKLEHLLNFRLLERTTREVGLTLAGRSFYQDNAHLLARYDESIRAARRIAEGKTGSLRLAYMNFAATELMPSAVARFRATHPHIDIALLYRRTQAQKIALANDEIDVGYMLGPFDHSEFHTVQLLSERLYVITPRSHAMLRLESITPADLADQDVILGEMAEWDEYRSRLDDLFSSEGIRLRVTMEASNTLALTGLVAAGLGITILPESLISFLGRNVEARPIMHPDFRSRTILAWKRANRAPQVQAFVAVARMLASTGA